MAYASCDKLSTTTTKNSKGPSVANPPRLVVVPDANPAGARALEYALVDHDYDYDYDYDINIKINIIKKN